MADVSKLRVNINGVFETFGVKDKIAREEVAPLKSQIDALGLSVVDGAINITYTV